MHFRLHPFPYVLQRLYRKDKDSLLPFQQGVYPKESPFFLKLFKALIFLISPLQSL